LYGLGLEHAASRLNEATLLQIDARRIPYQGEFDVIGAFDVLEHIEEDELVLAQMRKALKQSNGGIIITVPQHQFLWSVVDEYSHHIRRYERQELVKKVEKAGFEIVKVTSFVSSLLPLMYLSRLSKKKQPETYNPNSEYRIPKLANALLESVLSAERKGIEAGLSYPMGGSLLVVAKIKDQQSIS
jgi:SAM-dependent methyltransferase